MKPVFFKTPDDFREWLLENHQKETELVVGFYKVGSGKPSMTWSESVDQALCFGWIDSVRKSIDETSYSNRFTPRRPNSNWSAINIKKVQELTNKGLMQPAGLAAYEKRTEKRSAVYSFENEAVSLSKALEKAFKANSTAWSFYQKQAPSYKKTCNHWVMSARREATRWSRLESLIKASEQGKRL